MTVGEPTTWRSLLLALTERQNLSAEQTGWVVRETVEGRAPTVALAGLLAALRVKGETADELVGVVDALLDSAIPVEASRPCHDIAGTGGDGTGAMNISTLAAIVAAGAGCTVVKHGGRAASSDTAGSADLIEALGIPLETSTGSPTCDGSSRRFRYLFAPRFNPGLRHAVDARRGLGVPTIFNLAAPLINPARPDHPVVGVADPRRVRVLAETLQRLGRCGLVVHGHDGLDKLTTAAASDVWIVRGASLKHLERDPAVLGLRPARLADLRGGPAAENAERARAVLAGQRGPLRDVVVLNAAAVIVAGTLTVGEAESQFRTAMRQAAEAIDGGNAAAVLDDYS
ncbi:MAG TPA: anthranilate phosphoribosyltransferase [Microlunatus sp.]